jgi:hypothetical protein
MKYLGFILVLLVLIAGTLGYVLAQGFTAKGTGYFIPIEFTDASGSPISQSALRALKVEMSDGTTCYLMSNVSGLNSLESMQQLTPLGCVK